MKKLIYIGIAVIFVLSVIIKAQIIRANEGAEIVTFRTEWQKQGKPVDVQQVAKGSLSSHLKISGVYQGKRKLTAWVPPSTARSLSSGQLFTTPTGVPGTVAFVSSDRDILTGLQKVVFRLKEPVQRHPGSILTTKVRTHTLEEALTIHSNALVKTKNGVFVWVVEDSTVKRIPIKLGRSNGEYTSILSGLQEGALVVVNGKAALQDSDQVSIHHRIGE